MSINFRAFSTKSLAYNAFPFIARENCIISLKSQMLQKEFGISNLSCSQRMNKNRALKGFKSPSSLVLYQD